MAVSSTEKLQMQREKIVNTIIDDVLANKKHLYDEGLLMNFNNHNGAKQNEYQGNNQIILSLVALSEGFTDPRWLTRKQAHDLGYTVQDNARPVFLEHWERKPIFVTEKDENGNALLDDKGKEIKKPLLDENGNALFNLRGGLIKYPVFNASQIDGMPPLPERKLSEEDKVKELETILAHSEAPILFDQRQRNFYSPTKDEIHLTKKEFFKSADFMYATALHEISHSTGHESRLNRLNNSANLKFGSPEYATEELVAEFSAAMLTAKYNLPFSELKNQENATEYIRSWHSLVKEDPNILFMAAHKASQSMQYIEEHMLTPYLEKEVRKEQANPTLGFAIDYIENRDMNENGEQLMVLGGGLHSFGHGSMAREYIKSKNLSIEEEAKLYGGNIYKTGEIYTGEQLHQLLTDIAKDDISSHINTSSYDKISLIPYEVDSNGKATPLKDPILFHPTSFQVNIGNGDRFDVTPDSTSHDVVYNLLKKNNFVEFSSSNLNPLIVEALERKGTPIDSIKSFDVSHLIPQSEQNKPLALSASKAYQTLIFINENTSNYVQANISNPAIPKQPGIEDLKLLDKEIKNTFNVSPYQVLENFNKQALVPIPLTKPPALDFNNEENKSFIKTYNVLEDRAVKEANRQFNLACRQLNKNGDKLKEVYEALDEMFSKKIGFAIEFMEGPNKLHNGKESYVIGGGERSFAYGTLSQQIIHHQNLSAKEEAERYGGHIYQKDTIYTGEQLYQLIGDLAKDDISSHVNQCGVNKVFLKPYLVDVNGKATPILAENRHPTLRLDIGDGNLITNPQTPKKLLIELVKSHAATKDHELVIDLTSKKSLTTPIKLSTTPAFKTLTDLNENLDNLMIAYYKGNIPKSLAQLDKTYAKPAIDDLEAGKNAETISLHFIDYSTIPGHLIYKSPSQFSDKKEPNKLFLPTYMAMKGVELTNTTEKSTEFTINGKHQVNLKGEVLDAPLKQEKNNKQPLPKGVSKPMYDEPVLINKPKTVDALYKEAKAKSNIKQSKINFERPSYSKGNEKSLERNKQ